MIYPKFYKKKFLLGYILKLVKNIKQRNRTPIWKLLFSKIFCDIHNKSLFMSLRAFLPSLSVLKSNQESEYIIRKVSVIREIRVVSILLANLIKFFVSL